MRTRFCLVVLTASMGVLPVAAHAQATDASPKMTMELRAMSAKKFVEIFAAKTGLPLTAEPSIANETILVNVKDLPRDTIMSQVADALEAKWVRETNHIRLIRTAEQKAARERRNRQYVFNTIDKSLAKFRDDIAKEPDFTPEKAENLARQVEQYIRSSNPNSMNGSFWQRQQQLETQGPSGRAVKRVLATFKTEELANLPPDYKIVYSTRPNAIQRPFPSDVMPAIRQLLKDSATWANAAKKRNFTRPGQEWQYSFGGLAASTEPLTDQVDRVMVFLSRGKNSPYVNVELTLVNRKGKRFGNASTNLMPFDNSDENREIFEERPPKDGEAVVQLTPESQELRKFLSWEERRKSGEPTGKVLEWLLNPEKYDPQSFAATDVVLSLRPLYCQNVITWVPDVLGSFAMRTTTPTLNQLKKQIEMFYEVTNTKGTLSFRPKLVSGMQAETIDRAMIGKILRRVKSGQPLTIEEKAYIAYEMKEDYNWTFMSYLQAISTTNDNEGIYFGDKNAAMYGSLSDMQRRKAFSEEGLTITELTPEQRLIVEKQVFGPFVYLNYQPSEQQTAGPAFDWDAFYNGVGREATELFPTGLPSTLTIKCVETKDEVIIPSQPENSDEPWYGPMPVDQFAAQMFYGERPDLFPWASQSKGFKNGTFRTAKRRMVSITLTLRDKISVSGQLDEKNFTVAKPVSYNQLPSDVLAAIQKKLVEMKEQYKDQKPGTYRTPARNTGTNIPPTR